MRDFKGSFNVPVVGTFSPFTMYISVLPNATNSSKADNFSTSKAKGPLFPHLLCIYLSYLMQPIRVKLTTFQPLKQRGLADQY